MTEQQYERIARWLDGRDVALSDAERRVAEQIRDDETFVGAMADVAPPEAALDRASRRMTAALARPSPWRRVGWFVTAAAVAAAIIVVAAMLMYGPGPSGPTPERIPGERIVIDSPGVPIDVMIREMETRIEDMEESIRPGMVVEMLAGEFESIETDSVLVTAGGGTADVEIDALEDELDNILLDPVEPWSFEDDV